MNMLLGILLSAIVLIAYAWIEKRLNQQACAVCGARVSADVIDQPCPRCDALINPLPGR
jgi:Zn finger protein HypA/HybF involved in hydrogenase expression